MLQAEKAQHFAGLHRRGEPLVLYNIWDAGGAKALADSGAPAIATGSWSVAAAQGYADGEAIPLDLVLQLMQRICATVDLPVTVDFEGGYAQAAEEVGENTRKILRTGAIGINFEDRIVGGEGLHSIATQAERIKAIREMAQEEGVPLFVNARTDLFLGTDPASHADRVSQAQEREAAYAEAGASGFFVPGLAAVDLIAKITEVARLPVNVMKMGEMPAISELAQAGVARVSYGPGPYRDFLRHLKRGFSEIV
jgi:2-methylisocitrate lyase-like PEP mutase family enzyme